ncbi:hypothetical protein [Type-E symbiont of Plautia stali]|uniref:hypothetical protein n=1 Tax=Type-E symbiont of Plautia stali TaxID=1560357 RepID=UPI00128E98EC|nr:hypothetical protein [Type-E symbiont of Plautia stali]
MSECPFCKAHIPEGASVCGSCGAEEVVGYVSQQTVKALVATGALIGIPAGIAIAVIFRSPPAFFGIYACCNFYTTYYC